MRNIFKIMFIALLVVGVGVCMSYAATPGYKLGHDAGDEMGQNKYPSDPHKTFRLVRYVPASTATTYIEDSASADSIVIWDTTSDDGVTVTLSSTSGDSRVAGIIVQTALTPEYGAQGNTAANDIGKRNWTWLQTYGKSEGTVQNLGAITVGQAIGCSTHPGSFSGFVASASDAAANGNAGFALDSGAKSATDVEIFVHCE